MPSLNRFTLALLLAASALAQAQSFTSIDIKPAHSSDPQSSHLSILPNGDLTATSINAIALISDAYAVPSNPSDRLPPLPSWVYTDRYDIEAKSNHAIPPKGSVPKPPRDLFRQILADRFHLVLRAEARSMPVYSLVVAPGGPRLKRAAPSDCIFDTSPAGCHNFQIGFGHPLIAASIDMDDLAHYLENWTDRPVVNKTSLPGLFTMSTAGWLPMRLPPPPPNGAGAVDFTRLQTIDAVLAGLGLALKKEVAPVPVYTVEQVDRP